MKLSVLSAGMAGLLTCACAASAKTDGQTMKTASAVPVGTVYSNMEEVYFDNQAENEPAPWTSLRLLDDGKTAVFLDAYGKLQSEPESWQIIDRDDEKMTIQLGERKTELRRANDVVCWGAVRKAADKPDGSADWLFEKDLRLHDQGGRVLIGGKETGAPETILRVRRVTWASGSSNRPSLVLYVHKPDAPDTAVSYSWADVEAERIGINLRWMQASCTVARSEPAETD